MTCEVIELSTILPELAVAGNLLDVRDQTEFAAGRIAGAKLLPLDEIEKSAHTLEREKPIFVICRTGRRSAEAQKKLLALGFSNVRNVAGGFEAWKKAGLPYLKDKKAVWSLERQVRFAAGSLVLLGILMSIFVWQPFVWLSALIGAGLVFAAATDTCAMGMLLSKQSWNR